MILGEWKTATIASGGVLSAEVNLGRPYETLLIVIPTIDSAQITIPVAEKSGGTFQEVYVTNPADGGDKKVISALGTGGTTWVAPIGGFQFIEVKASAAQTGGARAFRVCGVRS